MACEYRVSGPFSVDADHTDRGRATGRRQQIGPLGRVVDCLGQVPENDQGMCFATAKAGGEPKHRPRFGGGGKATEHVPAQLGQCSRRVGVLEEQHRFAVDIRPLAPNQLPEAGSEDRVIEFNLANVLPRLAARLHSHLDAHLWLPSVRGWDTSSWPQIARR